MSKTKRTTITLLMCLFFTVLIFADLPGLGFPVGSMECMDCPDAVQQDSPPYTLYMLVGCNYYYDGWSWEGPECIYR